MRRIRGFSWHRQWGSVAALIVASVLTLVFGLRLADSALHWSERRDAPIAAWMTLGYIARSWDVDRDGLATALGVAVVPGERLTLEGIAARTGTPLAKVMATVERRVHADGAGPGDQP